jgi:hypothetical protein
MSADNGKPQTIREWFARAADHARWVVRERVEEAAQQVAQAAHEEIDRVVTKAEARLRRGAVYAGALLTGVALVVVGVSGAVGELLGRAWLGQLIVGAVVAGVAVVWLVLASRAAKRKAHEEDLRKAAATAVTSAEHSSVASAGAAGWLAGRLLAERKASQAS